MDDFRYKSSLLNSQSRWQSNLKVINSPKITTRLIVLASLLITIGSLVYLWQWNEYRKLWYEVRALKLVKQNHENKLKLKQIEINYLSRPQRLEEIAVKSLGMKVPKAISKTLTITQIKVPKSDQIKAQ